MEKEKEKVRKNKREGKGKGKTKEENKETMGKDASNRARKRDNVADNGFFNLGCLCHKKKHLV